MSTRAGHVFVVQGDLRRLTCDAWLVPSGREPRPEPHWLEWPPGASPPREFEASEAWRAGRCRVMRVEPWAEGMSPPWLVHVGGSPRTRVEWFVEGVEEALAAVAQSLEGQPPRHQRARHLVAVPVVGTAGGGAWERTGEVVRALLPALQRAVEAYGFDVALVTRDEETFAAAQAQRRRAGLGWPALGERLEAEALALAERVHEGDLVLLVGAGASAAAGVPLWSSLLRVLAEEAGLSAAEREALAALDSIDQARVIERRLEAREGREGDGAMRPLVRAVLRHVQCCFPSLSQLLMAALPVREVVTTNYDRLFELACEGVGRRVSVLPHAPDRHADLWLMKMHGSVERPQDIVLTREDYLRYDERRAALAGIVQALLMTRHMLFVGFSLQDDNFHRMVDAVRRALRPSASAHLDQPYGTALVLTHQPLLEELWRGELRWVALGGEEGEAARRLEVFLDCLLAHARASTAHLLAERFDGVLSEDERSLRDELRALLARVPPSARRTRAWREVERMVVRLGGKVVDGE